LIFSCGRESVCRRFERQFFLVFLAHGLQTPKATVTPNARWRNRTDVVVAIRIEDLPTENTTGRKRAAMSQDISHRRDREKTPG
jgi:hypothetical protein